MLKKMRSRFRSRCSQSNAVINVGDWILYDTATKRAVLEPDSDSITFFGENGPSTFYRNKRGKCIDAPCCGCCTI